MSKHVDVFVAGGHRLLNGLFLQIGDAALKPWLLSRYRVCTIVTEMEFNSVWDGLPGTGVSAPVPALMR